MHRMPRPAPHDSKLACASLEGVRTVPCTTSRNVVHGAPFLANRRTRRATSTPRFCHRDSRPDVVSLQRFHPLRLSGRCNAPVSLGAARSGFDVVVRLLPQLRSWARAHRERRPRQPLLPRGRAAEPSVAFRRTTECRSLPDTGLQSCMVTHAASDVAFDDAGFQASLCDGAWCLDCEPRTPRRSSFDDRRAFARVDGLEPRNRTRRPVEPLLEVRRAPFVIEAADVVGWRSDTSSARTAALRRRPEHAFDRGSPSTCAPRRATPLTNRGAIRRRSLVRTHAADCSVACCMLERAEALRFLRALHTRNLDAFST